MTLDDNARTGESPRLSIVLATWQAASTLHACLQSTLEQSFTHWELLVADGASTQATTPGDADGDLINLAYEWSVNGVVVATTPVLLPPFAVGDVIGVTVTPSDDDEDGESVSAPEVEVQPIP